MTPKDRNSLS